MKQRSRPALFSLSFLDIMFCGFGATVLLFMIISRSSVVLPETVDPKLASETRLMEQLVEVGTEDLLQLRNALHELNEENDRLEGKARELVEEVTRERNDLEDVDQSTFAEREHMNQLMADVREAEETLAKLKADRARKGPAVHRFIGSGYRQYLNGIRVGGERVLVFLDASASMLEETIVNVVRLRNMPFERKVQADKWQRALKTVDWITTQIPVEAEFQIYWFNTEAHSVLEGTDGEWLDVGEGERLDAAVDALRKVDPQNGTSLHSVLDVILQMKPDNVFLVTDGLPTRGRTQPLFNSVSGARRLRLFDQVMEEINAIKPRVPVNIVLFPMEGDPRAASAYWELAQVTGGSFMSPSRDWP